jgi:flavin-dependent dehydrogenase
VVVDQAFFPRDKLCAGAITGGGLGEMERAGLSLRVPHATVEHAVIRIAGRSQRIPLTRAAAVVRRRDWDADLVAQIRVAGAEVLEGAPVLALREDEGGGTALAGSRRISFRLAVAADGAAGASRRLLGLPPGRRVPLREVAVEGRGGSDLLFDLDAGVPGYAWRFPAAGPEGESTGLYSLEAVADTSDRLLRWLEREGSGRAPGGAIRSMGPRAWSIRVFDPSGPAGRGPVLLAGEALGADPLAGEGIRYALWSGRIAGDLAALALLLRLPKAAISASLRRAYRLRLATTRSGLSLALGASLAPRLYRTRPPERFRRMAADAEVARALAAIASGSAPAGPLLRLAARYLSLASGTSNVAGRGSQA